MTAASEKTLARLTKGLKQRDVGDLRDALFAQVAAGISQTAASAMIELVEALPLTAVHARQLARNSFAASFLAPDAKRRHLDAVDHFFATL